MYDINANLKSDFVFYQKIKETNSYILIFNICFIGLEVKEIGKLLLMNK